MDVISCITNHTLRQVVQPECYITSSHIYLRPLLPVHNAAMFVKDIQAFKDQDLPFEFLSGILEAD